MPVLLIGAEKVLPKKTIFVNQDQLSQKVKVKVLPPVDASQFGEEGIDDLRDLCREKMVDGANNY